jgi:phage/plasmid-associated DNA primase
MSVYSEGESSDKIEMNSAGLKQISGEDSLCGRELYGNQITFTPYTKLHMLTNFTPPLNAEFAIKQRLRYIFLDSEFVDNPDLKNNRQFKKDKEFTDSLETIYLNEVFSWIVKGAQEYYKTLTINMPEDFQKRTDTMLNNEDSIKTFTDRKIIITNIKSDIIKKNDIFEAYKNFCNNNSQRCQPRSSLFNRLEHLKITTSVLHGYDVFRGIKLNTTDDYKEIDNGIFDDEDEPKINYELLYKQQQKEIIELKNKINLLESAKPKVKKVIKATKH